MAAQAIVRNFIERNFPLRPDDIVVVGLSGGADSVCLLHILLSLGVRCQAAHCNFHLRGAESERDERFVTEMAEKLGVELHKTHFDTKKISAERKISIEMAARELRYAWFEEIRRRENARFVAVAHHADDAAETFFLNLIRGTGIQGLCGIAPKNGNVIRPLLCLTRSEISQYLAEKNLPHVEDSSNADTVFLRNKIRLDILPELRKANAAFDENLAKTMRHLTEVRDIYTRHTDAEKRAVCTQNGEFLHIDIEKLKKSVAPRSLLFETLKTFGFRSAQMSGIFESLDAESGKQFFSESHALTKDRNSLIVSKIKTETEILISASEKSIDAPVGLTFERITRDSTFSLEKNPSVGYFDLDKLTFPLRLRNWRQGDRFIPFGMRRKKKVSDFFIDQKFSRPQKESTLLLLSGDEIVWIVGIRPDERFKISPSTQNILKICIK